MVNILICMPQIVRFDAPLTPSANGHHVSMVAHTIPLSPTPFCCNGIGLVGPVGLEPTTYGLKERPKPARNAYDPPFCAWLLDTG